MQSLVNILSTGATAAIVAGLVVWIFREWISSRIKANIQHKYEISILELKNEIGQKIALYETSQQSFAEGQKASMERKLDAIDMLWGHVIMLREMAPPEIRLIDLLLTNEIDQYEKIKNGPKIKVLFRTWSEEERKEKMDSIFNSKDEQIEKIRPYVGEHLWTTFSAMKVIYQRLLLILLPNDILETSDEMKIKWYQDEVIGAIIKLVLTKDELIEFNQLKFQKFSVLQKKLELKILTETQKIISGEHFSAESLREAEKIQQKIANVKSAENYKIHISE